jgi:hypothetical protein
MFKRCVNRSSLYKKRERKGYVKSERMSLEKKGEIDGSWQGEYIRKGCGGWDTQWGGGGGVGEVYKKKLRIEPNMMLVLPIKICSRVQS